MVNFPLVIVLKLQILSNPTPLGYNDFFIRFLKDNVVKSFYTVLESILDPFPTIHDPYRASLYSVQLNVLRHTQYAHKKM